MLSHAAFPLTPRDPAPRAPRATRSHDLSRLLLAVSMETTVFGAGFSLCVLVVVFFLYMNRKWCFSNTSGNFPCCDEKSLSTKTIHSFSKYSACCFDVAVRLPSRRRWICRHGVFMFDLHFNRIRKYDWASQRLWKRLEWFEVKNSWSVRIESCHTTFVLESKSHLILRRLEKLFTQKCPAISLTVNQKWTLLGKFFHWLKR